MDVGFRHVYDFTRASIEFLDYSGGWPMVAGQKSQLGDGEKGNALYWYNLIDNYRGNFL